MTLGRVFKVSLIVFYVTLVCNYLGEIEGNWPWAVIALSLATGVVSGAWLVVRRYRARGDHRPAEGVGRRRTKVVEAPRNEEDPRRRGKSPIRGAGLVLTRPGEIENQTRSRGMDITAPVCWEPEVRMSVHLEDIAAIVTRCCCTRTDCISTAPARAAIEVLRDWISQWPPRCEHLDG
jgi:hypothetical protein